MQNRIPALHRNPLAERRANAIVKPVCPAPRRRHPRGRGQVADGLAVRAGLHGATGVTELAEDLGEHRILASLCHQRPVLQAE
jgi:hypothetical protein